ncbi:MAG TPA: lamin tail domain-containing protein [Kofleriaceae bacterium]|nr:lamin tail domain-containing protein [Kofleriaceae bacterium]
MPRTVSPFLISATVLAGWLGCATVDEAGDLAAAVTVPARGTASTLDIGEWNLEWFGATGNGPTNKALQLANVRDVIGGADLDLWALEEVVSATQFDQLKAQLTGYDGFLANDPSVTSGSSFYTSGEQKVGVLFKSSVIAVRGARLILTSSNNAFAGRPPLEVDLTATVDGASIDFTLIVLHAKAMADVTSYNRRVDASNALKAYLDASHPGDRVLVTGDFNDDLGVSISGGGRASPYKSFVDDTAHYTWPSKAFTDANQKTTVSGSRPIDHHLLTAELAPFYVADSAEVYRVDQFVPKYGTTTTDHFPTLARYSLGAPPSPARLILNEILANEPGSDTAGELVEIVNVGGAAADLSGLTLSDSTAVRHVFADGTTLAPGKAIVVYGGAAAIPAGITAVPASTGGLSLGNSGDTVTLRDGAGTSIDAVTYPSSLGAVDGVSMNRNPDASATGVFALHTAISTSPASPGTRANGTGF